MPKHNIPAYAIVELLIRLSHHNKLIGDYKGHTVRTEDVLVKTTGGKIYFSRTLIMQQFSNPDLIGAAELVKTASLFNAVKVKRQTISR
jgi:hypothetical protein